MDTGHDSVVRVDRGAGRGTTTVAWIALIAALLALALAWAAFNRTGQDLEDKIQQSVQESVQGIEEGAEQSGDAIDAGPDGIDEDDTDVNSGTVDGTEETTPTIQP
ncbi:hypothetical protein B7Z28_01210 [Candidatus Saccharibacteria bacterium 32-45-3]|nr:MAG: hypothetical protein B7Z28_01210 [Candidatus Saccharibacteria bacterium 32-45-3]